MKDFEIKDDEIINKGFKLKFFDLIKFYLI